MQEKLKMEEFKFDFNRRLTEFITAGCRNAWLDVGPMRMYVRKSKRLVDGKLLTAFDIASVSVCEEMRRSGYFKAALEVIHEICHDVFECLFVENVISEPLYEYFKKTEGWTEVSYMMEVLPSDSPSPLVSSFVYKYETPEKP